MDLPEEARQVRVLERNGDLFYIYTVEGSSRTITRKIERPDQILLRAGLNFELAWSMATSYPFSR